MAGPISRRADRFVRKLYTRGKSATPPQEVNQREVRDVLQRLSERRSRLIRRNLRGT